MALTKEQESRVEQLANAHGRVCVSHGYQHGKIEALVPCGQRFVVEPHGTMVDYR